MLWNHQRAEEERRDKTEKEISRAAAEHVAQFNQYFLVIAGISLRNKPSLINHMEKSQLNSDRYLGKKKPLAEAESLYGVKVIECHSICYSV